MNLFIDCLLPLGIDSIPSTRNNARHYDATRHKENEGSTFDVNIFLLESIPAFSSFSTLSFYFFFLVALRARDTLRAIHNYLRFISFSHFV